MWLDDEPADAFDDFGYANGWGDEEPDKVRKCTHLHPTIVRTVIGRGLTEYKCWECRYIYKVDSSG